MANIDLATLRRVAAMQRRYADGLARQAAERRLDEIEAWLDAERQRRSLAPVTNDSGKVIGWTRTRPQVPGGR
jgi:L-amino acid N-acyltransferase YncA